MKATRCYYRALSEPPFFSEQLATFQYEPGRDPRTHSLNSRRLVDSIQELEHQSCILEVSTASSHAAGVMLSALNLHLNSSWGKHSVERIFQASKVFEFGGPFQEILGINVAPKSFAKLTTSGKLIGFKGPDGLQFPADGTSGFYDRLYIRALIENPHLLAELLNFDVFTDLRFAKRVRGFVASQPINTQARSCAIAKSLFALGGLERLTEYVSLGLNTPVLPISSPHLFDDW